MSEDAGLSVRTIASVIGLDEVIDLDEDESTGPCDCETRFGGDTLYVDSGACDGTLANAVDCREAAIRRLTETDTRNIIVTDDGLEYRYSQAAVDLLSAAGRFIDLLGDRDERLAETAATDPLSAARELSERVGPIAEIGRESGLIQTATEFEEYADVFSPDVGLSIGHYYLDRSAADGSMLRDVSTLDTGSEVRIYKRPDSVPLYALDVVDIGLSDAERRLLLDGYQAIAEGDVDGTRAASRAIEHVSTGQTDPVVTQVLEKHTRGYGVLEDIFSDSRVTDVYVTSPVDQNPVRVEVDGEAMATNIHMTEDGAGALASRVRRTSGRAFSRANPTVDATASLRNGTGLRVAGVTDPVTEGVAFAFREQADDRFTLPGLVANGTMTPSAAGFLSIAIERNAAAMIAGTRGAGKTTLLGTLLYELSPETRTVVIEDTPELPVDPLQSVDRDVQALRTGTGDGPEITAVDALRTALRLGDGALVVGEIRGEEAQVLYEAMRVGANANAVLGTIHGDGADDVYERVVSDLGVQPSSFGATDLIVTVQAYRTPEGRKRRISAIEEVIVGEDDIWFQPLFEIDEDKARPTGRIEKGESRFVDRITGPNEEYATVMREITDRSREIEQLATDGRTDPQEVAAAYADRTSQ